VGTAPTPTAYSRGCEPLLANEPHLPTKLPSATNPRARRRIPVPGDESPYPATNPRTRRRSFPKRRSASPRSKHLLCRERAGRPHPTGRRRSRRELRPCERIHALHAIDGVPRQHGDQRTIPWSVLRGSTARDIRRASQCGFLVSSRCRTRLTRMMQLPPRSRTAPNYPVLGYSRSAGSDSAAYSFSILGLSR
jgi:hypothetical protein